jgi:hypothetical protein
MLINLLDGTEIKEPFPGVSFDMLETRGFLFLRDGRATLPYILLYQIANTQLLETAIDSILVRPAQVLEWQGFEKLEPALLSTVVQCMQAVGLRSALVGHIWKGSFASPDVHNMDLQLPSRMSLLEENECWIKKGAKKSGTRLVTPNHEYVRCDNGHHQLSKSIGTIFRCCKNNPSFDVRSLWLSTSGQKILVLEQLKKSEKMKTETKASKIQAWWKKGYDAVSVWAQKFQFQVSIFSNLYYPSPYRNVSHFFL